MNEHLKKEARKIIFVDEANKTDLDLTVVFHRYLDIYIDKATLAECKWWQENEKSLIDEKVYNTGVADERKRCIKIIKKIVYKTVSEAIVAAIEKDI